MQGYDAKKCCFFFLILFYLSISPYYYLLYHFLLIMSACFLNILLVHPLFGPLLHVHTVQCYNNVICFDLALLFLTKTNLITINTHGIDKYAFSRIYCKSKSTLFLSFLMHQYHLHCCYNGFPGL